MPNLPVAMIPGHPGAQSLDELRANVGAVTAQQVIDNLLATPQPQQPVDLVRPNVMYMYADPGLESRSAGQKLLMRMGPDNAAAIKAKLTELRAAITASAPKR